MNRINKTTYLDKDCSGRGDVIFRKVTIASVFGDDITGSMKPENGAYKNALVFYEASGVSYLYDSDGVYTKIANIEGSTENVVVSINGKQGVVTLTLAELGGKTEQEINQLITSKGYQTASQVDIKIATAKSQIESEIPSKTSDLVNDSNFQNATQVDAKVAAEATARQAAITAVENEIPDVIDSVTSTSADNALSAKQGKLLNDRITNIDSRGRYLSTWDSTTGTPGTEPEVLPYAYRTGDYFIVATVGATNYRPTGSQYTGDASTVLESETVSPNDTYLYDGTTWELIHTEIPQIAVDENLSTTSRNPVENRTITNALGDIEDDLDDKQDTLTAGDNIDITNNVISATDTTYTAGDNITITNNEISADVPELLGSTGQSTVAGMTQKAITDALASAGGGDKVYSTKTTSDSAAGGAVYIGGKDADQNVLEDPTTTDNHYKYFWALPSIASSTPTDSTVVIMGSVKSGAEHSVAINSSQRADTYAVSINGDESDQYSVAINGRVVSGKNSIAIGRHGRYFPTFINADNSISIGGGMVNYTHSISLGAGSQPRAKGVMDISTSAASSSYGGSNTAGYNGTGYRLISGLHDPEQDHDAATKGYVDAAVGDIETLMAALISGGGAQ